MKHCKTCSCKEQTIEVKEIGIKIIRREDLDRKSYKEIVKAIPKGQRLLTESRKDTGFNEAVWLANSKYAKELDLIPDGKTWIEIPLEQTFKNNKNCPARWLYCGRIGLVAGNGGLLIAYDYGRVWFVEDLK